MGAKEFIEEVKRINYSKVLETETKTGVRYMDRIHPEHNYIEVIEQRIRIEAKCPKCLAPLDEVITKTESYKECTNPICEHQMDKAELNIMSACATTIYSSSYPYDIRILSTRITCPHCNKEFEVKELR